MRLTGLIPKQSSSTAQIQPPPWLNLRRKPELNLLPLELDFLYGEEPLDVGAKGPDTQTFQETNVKETYWAAQ